MPNLNGDELTRARRFRGITQTELGQKCGLARGYISWLENHETNNIRASTLTRLQRALRCRFST